MLVVAGAGTGKTTVLVERLVRLVSSGEAKPEEVFAITYTKNAAQQLKDRVRERLGARGAKIWTGNFHAYCYELLKRHRRNFGILEPNDLWVYLRRRMARRELPLERYIRAAAPAVFLNDLLTFFERCHDELVDAARYELYVQQVAAGELPPPRVARQKEQDALSDDEKLARCREIARVFRAVEQMLAREKLGTFGHQITRAVSLLREKPEVLDAERRRARYLLIDEFQDANFAQIELATLLAGDERNIFAVGDPDQAIYQFRGASSAAFDEFLRRFPETRAVTLRENRRSTSPILTCAHSVIRRNPEISGPSAQVSELKRRRLESGREADAKERSETLPREPVNVVIATSVEEEAANIAEAIGRMQEASSCRCPEQRHLFGWCNFAVLYRQHRHREEVIRELAARRIPFVVKALDVLDTPEGRDAIALMRAVATGDGISQFRAAALPQYSIRGEEFRERLALHRGKVAEALADLEGGKALLQEVASTREEVRRRQLSASAALHFIERRFALSDSEPLRVLREFVERWREKPLAVRGDLDEFLEYLDWYVESGGRVARPEDDEDTAVPDAVRLMSVHGAKGLEFQHVFVLRVIKPGFPTSHREPLFEMPNELRGPAAPATDPELQHYEEERRLFYVAMTRARDTLTLSSKRGAGKKDPSPPGYLRELLTDREAAPFLRQRAAEPYATGLAAAAPASAVAAWMELPPMRRLDLDPLSATAIENYDRCPLKYKMERDWKLPEEPAGALSNGWAMHTALKAFFDAVQAGRPMTEPELQACFAAASASVQFEDEFQRELYAQQGRQQLHEFYELVTRSPFPRVQATEQRFQVEVGGAKVVGRFDRVDTLDGAGVAITDYKSGRPRDDDDADRSLQLSVYALAATKLGMRPERLAFFNLENSSTVTTTRSASDLRSAENKIAEIASAIAAGKFQARPGYHCGWCGWRSLCPETEERLFQIAPRSDAASAGADESPQTKD